MKTADFVNVILNAPNGLASVVALDVKARRVNARTADSHAAHAVELLANRRGLKVLVTRPDDGSFVVGLTGFSR